jgi:hypothetical protein
MTTGWVVEYLLDCLRREIEDCKDMTLDKFVELSHVLAKIVAVQEVLNGRIEPPCKVCAVYKSAFGGLTGVRAAFRGHE